MGRLRVCVEYGSEEGFATIIVLLTDSVAALPVC